MAVFPTDTNVWQLTPEQVKKFIHDIAEKSKFLGEVDVRTMKSTKQNFTILAWAHGQMRRKGVSNPVSATANQVTIDAGDKPILLTVTYSDEDRDTNIEGRSFEKNLPNIMKELAAGDLEDLVLNGDVDSADAFLKTMDGLFKLGASTVPASQQLTTGANLLTDPQTVFADMIKALPSKYKKDKPNMRIYVSTSVLETYIEKIGQRLTSLGDRALEQGNVSQFNGYPVVGLPYMKDDHAILTHRKNIVLGIYLYDFVIEYQRDIRQAEENFWRLKFWGGTNFAIADGVVLVTPA